MSSVWSRGSAGRRILHQTHVQLRPGGMRRLQQTGDSRPCTWHHRTLPTFFVERWRQAIRNSWQDVFSFGQRAALLPVAQRQRREIGRFTVSQNHPNLMPQKEPFEVQKAQGQSLKESLAGEEKAQEKPREIASDPALQFSDAGRSWCDVARKVFAPGAPAHCCH